MLRFRRRLSMVVTAAVVAGLASVAPGTPASAAVPGLLPPISAETNFDSTVYKSVRVFCPLGTQVIGGGYDLVGAEGAVVLDDFIPSETNLLVGAGEIVGPGEASDGTTASWKIVATVVCAGALPGYSVEVGSSDFNNDRLKRADAFCPPGRALIGGGGSMSNGFGQTTINSVSLLGSEVAAFADDDQDGYSGNWSVTAYAICAAAQPLGWQVVRQPTTQTTQAAKAVTAFCPPGQTPIGATWATLITNFGSTSSDIYPTRAVVSTTVNPRVAAAALALDTRSTWALRADAVCVNS